MTICKLTPQDIPAAQQAAESHYEMQLVQKFIEDGVIMQAYGDFDPLLRATMLLECSLTYGAALITSIGKHSANLVEHCIKEAATSNLHHGYTMVSAHDVDRLRGIFIACGCDVAVEEYVQLQERPVIGMFWSWVMDYKTYSHEVAILHYWIPVENRNE